MDDVMLTLCDSPWERFLRDTADRMIELTDGDYEACRLLAEDQPMRLDQAVLIRVQSKLGLG